MSSNNYHILSIYRLRYWTKMRSLVFFEFYSIIDLILHDGKVGEVYNIGGHNENANIDIVKIICKELGKPESLITYVADRKGHDVRYAIDPTKIHSKLGWLSETKFVDAIKKTIQWYLDNREWWESIISREYQNYYVEMYEKRMADAKEKA